MLYVRSFKGADCDTTQCTVVAKLKEIISIRKRERRKFDDVEVKERNQVEISNRFAALEGLDESFDNNILESIRENIKTSAKENVGYQKLKHYKPWFHDDCSKLIAG
jgi:hypothetical protein